MLERMLNEKDKVEKNVQLECKGMTDLTDWSCLHYIANIRIAIWGKSNNN